MRVIANLAEGSVDMKGGRTGAATKIGNERSLVVAYLCSMLEFEEDLWRKADGYEPIWPGREEKGKENDAGVSGLSCRSRREKKEIVLFGGPLILAHNSRRQGVIKSHCILRQGGSCHRAAG